MEVYRYRCRNPEYAHGSFIHLPLDLSPHSPYRLEMRRVALEVYARGRSTYRCTTQALGVFETQE